MLRGHEMLSQRGASSRLLWRNRRMPSRLPVPPLGMRPLNPARAVMKSALEYQLHLPVEWTLKSDTAGAPQHSIMSWWRRRAGDLPAQTEFIKQIEKPGPAGCSYRRSQSSSSPRPAVINQDEMPAAVPLVN